MILVSVPFSTAYWYWMLAKCLFKQRTNYAAYHDWMLAKCLFKQSTNYAAYHDWMLAKCLFQQRTNYAAYHDWSVRHGIKAYKFQALLNHTIGCSLWRSTVTHAGTIRGNPSPAHIKRISRVNHKPPNIFSIRLPVPYASFATSMFGISSTV
jgi:hypothetical protein